LKQIDADGFRNADAFARRVRTPFARVLMPTRRRAGLRGPRRPNTISM
jgi:hypothetical protein